MFDKLCLLYRRENTLPCRGDAIWVSEGSEPGTWDVSWRRGGEALTFMWWEEKKPEEHIFGWCGRDLIQVPHFEVFLAGVSMLCACFNLCLQLDPEAETTSRVYIVDLKS